MTISIDTAPLGVAELHHAPRPDASAQLTLTVAVMGLFVTVVLVAAVTATRIDPHRDNGTDLTDRPGPHGAPDTRV